LPPTYAVSYVRLLGCPAVRMLHIHPAPLGLLASLALVASPPQALASTQAPNCAPQTSNVSQSLANGAVTVSPAPDSFDASYLTQISFLGVPAAELADVSVSGSRSGTHSGRLEAYSQGDGASFLPSKPFSQGETVTVNATLHQGATTTPFSWHFTLADVDATSRSLETPPPPPPPPKASELQYYSSRPELRPPTVSVSTDSAGQAPGDIFLAPYAGPGQYGPMVLNGSGQLVWFKPIPHGERAADLRVQTYDGQPVLTWWQDPLVADGQSDAGVVIADDSYHDIQIVRAGNGYQPDLHAFEITPKGTALFTVYDAIRCNLSAYGGPADGAVADTLFQEIDLKTGLVRYEWHALDHVPLSDSYMPIGGGGTQRSPWDWFHINAVSEHPGTLLVDSRNTWAAYDISSSSGEVLWRLGGKQSSFHMGPGATPAWQHDVREEPDGTISFFDNGGTPKVHPQSRVIELQLNKQAMTATLMLSFEHPTPLAAASQGDFQPLADGNWFTGWGQEPFFTEYTGEGKVLFDAHLPAAYQSYTVLKFPWAGKPKTAPALRLLSSAHGQSAYVSWNGATEVTGWRLLGGSTAAKLEQIAQSPSTGFQTAFTVSGQPTYLQAQALDASGQVLGSSAVERMPSSS
jgi:hypothetical protein